MRQPGPAQRQVRRALPDPSQVLPGVPRRAAHRPRAWPGTAPRGSRSRREGRSGTRGRGTAARRARRPSARSRQTAGPCPADLGRRGPAQSRRFQTVPCGVSSSRMPRGRQLVADPVGLGEVPRLARLVAALGSASSTSVVQRSARALAARPARRRTGAAPARRSLRGSPRGSSPLVQRDVGLADQAEQGAQRAADVQVVGQGGLELARLAARPRARTPRRRPRAAGSRSRRATQIVQPLDLGRGLRQRREREVQRRCGSASRAAAGGSPAARGPRSSRSRSV